MGGRRGSSPSPGRAMRTLYVASSSARGIRWHTRFTGGIPSRSWSTGKMPLHTISAVVVANAGKTRPGQSHKHRSSSRLIVYDNREGR